MSISSKEAFSRQARIFSQNGEDGVLLYLLSQISEEHFSKQSFEIGASVFNSQLECNTRVLLENGWQGVIIDAQEIVHPLCKQAKVTRENITDLLKAEEYLLERFGVLSIDVDGNDYWLWKEIPDKYCPAIVIIEYNASIPCDRSVVQPYTEAVFWANNDFFGASAKAMIQLAHSKGYKLVTTVHHLNMFFVREELLDIDFQEPSLKSICSIKRHNTHPNPQYIEV